MSEGQQVMVPPVLLKALLGLLGLCAVAVGCDLVLRYRKGASDGIPTGILTPGSAVKPGLQGGRTIAGGGVKLSKPAPRVDGVDKAAGAAGIRRAAGSSRGGPGGSTGKPLPARVVSTGGHLVWPPPDRFGMPAGHPIGRYRITYYWLANELEFAGPRGKRVRGVDGSTLAVVNRRFYSSLMMQGAGVLATGQLVNMIGRCSSRSRALCFKLVDRSRYPYGMGAKSRSLELFRSVAVDKSKIPIGTRLYIPELEGLRMPDGRFHDGCVNADDIGKFIKGRRIDWFVGCKANYQRIHSVLTKHWVKVYIGSPRCLYDLVRK